jgi:peptidoglycan/LPS O-acetylase OafA/YrhL
VAIVRKAGDRENSFTFLRLVFSLTVVFSHCFPIGGFGLDPLMRASGGQAQMGFVAVLCFFIVSGFLITGSAERLPLGRFGLNRCARILPGYWTAQLLVALVLAPVVLGFLHPTLTGYGERITMGPSSALSFLWRNSGFHLRQYFIADVFAGQPAGAAVNGAMWSLGPEVMCYLSLAVFAICGGLHFRVLTLLVFGAVYALQVVGHFNPMAVLPVSRVFAHVWFLALDHPLFRSLYVAFVAGMLSFQFRAWLRWNGWLFTAALALLAGSLWMRCFDLAWPFLLPYVVLFLAYRLPFSKVERWGDFSYGIYIYSFPMQQCLTFAGLPQLGLLPFIGASLSLALVAGMLSWRGIEKPVLDWAHRFGKRHELAAKSPVPAAVG